MRLDYMRGIRQQPMLMWFEGETGAGGPTGPAGPAGGATGPTGAADPDADIDAIEGLGDAGKAALRAERKAKREAEAKAQQHESALATLAAQVADLTKADSDRKEDERKAAEKAQREQGKWEELANTATNERDTAIGERDTAKQELATVVAERDALRAAVDKQVAEQFDPLPDVVKALYAGAADDPLAKLDFLSKSAALIEQLNGKAVEQRKEAKGNPLPPHARDTSSTADKKDDADAEARRRNANRYG